MTDNPWLPIDTMPLSTVGTEVDIQESRRLYSGVTVAGLNYDHELITETDFCGGRRTYFGRAYDFNVKTTTGDIRVTTNAQWRPHV